MRPERKEPQLLMVPFYDEAIAEFARHCSERVSLELEVSTYGGEPTWTVSAYSGPRSVEGLTVNHFIPRTDKPLTRTDVIEAAASLGMTSERAWVQRRRKAEAKAALEKAGRGIGRIVHVG